MPNQDLPRSSPEAKGVSSSSISDFVHAAEEAKLGLHSLMMVRGGAVVAEGWWAPYRQNDVHLLYSLSKSFTSSAIGMAIQEGLLTLDDQVISFFPDETPPNPSSNLHMMKVRHLLSMSAGQAVDDLAELHARADGDWVRGFLERPVDHEPGTQFLYNSTATYMLSAIIQKKTGLSTLAYLRPRLLDPLGIDRATWETCPKGISCGGWGMSVTTESIAKFGQLYLQKGLWNGKRILSKEWIETATRSHISNGDDPKNDWNQGYGFQFWRCRHNCYRGDGAFGQYCIVIPHADMVVAITSAVDDMGAVLNLVWKHLLKSMRCTEERVSLGFMRSLVLPGPISTGDCPVVPTPSHNRFIGTGSTSEIESAEYDFDAGGCCLSVKYMGETHTFRAGAGKWVYGSTSIQGKLEKVAAIGAWTSNDEYEIRVCNVESPTQIWFSSRFEQDRVNLVITLHYQFSPSEGPKFEGIAA